MRATPLRRGLFALGWALLAAALLAGLLGLWLFASTLGLFGAARTVEGVVVGHETVTVSNTRSRGAAHGQRSVVRFRTEDGRSYTITESLVRRLDAVHDLGETVSVRYHPDAPEAADVVWPWLRGFGAVALLAAAVIGLPCGGLLVLLTRPRRPAAPG